MSNFTLPFIADALNVLQRISIHREPEQWVPFAEDSFTWPALQKALTQINQAPGLLTPTIVDAAVIETWHRHITGKERVNFSTRELKTLCWAPDVVLNPEFTRFIEPFEDRLSSSAIQGVLYCYHAKYPQSAESAPLQALLQRLISSRAARLPLMAQWSNDLSMLVGLNAAKNMGKGIMQSRHVFAKAFEDTRLYPGTAFAQRAANFALLDYVDSFSKLKEEEVKLFYQEVLSSPLIDKDTYYKALSALILDPFHQRNEAAKKRLLTYLMTVSDLQDPRIYQAKWAKIHADARQRVVQWLSSQEIDFFFGLLISDKTDRQKRKPFWLSYVPRVLRSRALLCQLDRGRHLAQLNELAERGTTYGLLKSAQCSAFVLDFGRIIAVEFSEVGCVYLYEQHDFSKLMPDLWTKEFKADWLKNKQVSIDYFPHTKDWQDKVMRVLSQYGIRR